MKWPFVSRRRHAVLNDRMDLALKRATKALDALEEKNEDGIHAARSYLYDVLFLLS